MDKAAIKLFGEDLILFKERLTYDARLERMWIKLEEKYHEPALTLSAIAKDCKLSENRLNELLNRYVGKTFHQILVCYRLYCAIQILRSRNEKVVDIAEEVGMSVSAFERNFVGYLGLGPAEFKDRCRLKFQRSA